MKRFGMNINYMTVGWYFAMAFADSTKGDWVGASAMVFVMTLLVVALVLSELRYSANQRKMQEREVLRRMREFYGDANSESERDKL